jgi:hypothetical protein
VVAVRMHMGWGRADRVEQGHARVPRCPERNQGSILVSISSMPRTPITTSGKWVRPRRAVASNWRAVRWRARPRWAWRGSGWAAGQPVGQCAPASLFFFSFAFSFL